MDKITQITVHSFLNRIFIVYTILLVPVTRMLDLPDKTGRIPSLLFILSCFWGLNDKMFKNVFIKPPVLLWILWGVYSFANWSFAGIPPKETTILGFLSENFILPAGMMIITYYEAMKDLKGTTFLLISTLCIYMFIGLLQESGTSTGTDWNARGGMLLGNDLPMTACSLVFTALLANVWGWLKDKHLYAICGLAIGIILMIATRKALGAVTIMVVFYVVAKFYSGSSNRIPKLFLAIILFGGAYMAIMGNTLMGRRMAEIEKQGKKSNKTDYEILDVLGDRASHYIIGWKAFTEHPVTGVGIKNTQALYPIKYPLHTEYMTQLAENGIIGTCLWLLFVGSIIKTIVRAKKNIPFPLWLICLSGLTYILFVDLTAWTFAFPRYFIVYGLIMAYCQRSTDIKAYMQMKKLIYLK